jgi:hypothetical protein
MDPLDWGVRSQPYLVVAVDERLTDPKEKAYRGGFILHQYGPFAELVGEDQNVGRFNTLDPTHHSMRLITIQLSVDQAIVQPWFMDLKRARNELKKVQKEQEWVLHIDSTHAEKTGEVLYIPKKLKGNTCGSWFESGGLGERCGSSEELTLTYSKGLPIWFCPRHRAADARVQYARRMTA